ncbi:MAG: hypothetical protein KJZ54_09745 [Phycisphaerales bacterium]|nr:hypothetical protein [Phycisphaerales bacterium]
MAKKKDPNRYPKRMTAAKARKIARAYDTQTEDAALAEDEAAFGRGLTTVMEIPTELVPEVTALIAEHESRLKASRGKRRKIA